MTQTIIGDKMAKKKEVREEMIVEGIVEKKEENKNVISNEGNPVNA